MGRGEWLEVGGKGLAQKNGGRWDVGLVGGGLSQLMGNGALAPTGGGRGRLKN